MDYSTVFQGSEVKMVTDYVIKGTAIVYGGRDLVGDYFTKETDLGKTRPFVGMPVYYDHALGNERNQIGVVKQWEETDGGIDVEIELNKRYKYVQQVLELVKKGVIGLSTGAVGNTVVREKGQLKRWVVGELSLTTTPCEPRTVTSAKAVGAEAQLDSTVGKIDSNMESKLGDTKMSVDKNELKQALNELAGEPVNGGGVVMPVMQAPMVNTIKSSSQDELKSAQLHWLRTGKMNDATTKAIIQEDSGTWGVSVAHDLQRTIIGKRDEMSVLSQLPINRITTSKEYYDINTENAKASFAFVAEGSSANESEPTAAQVSIRLYKASLMMKISNEILEDTSNNLEEYLTDAIARAYALNVNTYLMNGTGSSQPYGVIPRISNSIALTSTTGVSTANVNDIFYGLPQAYHGNDTGWAMRIATLGAIRALTVSGAFAFQETPVGSTNGEERLKYRPVAMTAGVPAMAASAKSIVFGNWRYLNFVEHSSGLKISRNPYLYEATGETAIFVTARWGSDVSQAEAFIRGTNPAS
jgi:HK97 family phage major capsid protein